MQINFDHLYSKGLSEEDFLVLQKLLQKMEYLIDESYDYQKLIELELVTEKGLTEKGKTFMQQLYDVNYSDGVAELAQKLLDMYSTYGVEGDSLLIIQDRIGWFMKETGFNADSIEIVVEEYLSEVSKFRFSLKNLIWNPPSKAFSVHKTLKDSKLYDMICKKFGINPNVIIKEKDKVWFKWLRGIAMLKVPKGLDKECYFESYQADSDNLIRLKEQFRQKLKGL